MKNRNKFKGKLVTELFDDNEVKPGYSRMGMFDRPGPSINTGKTIVPELPLSVMPQMATQLSVEMPPIDDSDYYPNTNNELALALQALAKRVPNEESKRIYNIVRKFVEKKYGQSNDNKVGHMNENLDFIIRELTEMISDRRSNRRNKYSLKRLFLENIEKDSKNNWIIRKKSYNSPFDVELQLSRNFMKFLEDPDFESDGQLSNEDVSLLDNNNEEIIDFFVSNKLDLWDYDMGSQTIYGYSSTALNPPVKLPLATIAQEQSSESLEEPASYTTTSAGYKLNSNENRIRKILDDYSRVEDVGDMAYSKNHSILRYSGISDSSSYNLSFVYHDLKLGPAALDRAAMALYTTRNKIFDQLKLSRRDLKGTGSESGKLVELSNYLVYVQHFTFDKLVLIAERNGSNYIIIKNYEVVEMKIKGVSNPLSDIKSSIQEFKSQNIVNFGKVPSINVIRRTKDIEGILGKPGYDYSANEAETYAIEQKDEEIEIADELIKNYYEQGYNSSEVEPSDRVNYLLQQYETKYGDLKSDYLTDTERAELIKDQPRQFSQDPLKGTPTIRAIVRRELSKAHLISLAKKSKNRIPSARMLQLPKENIKKYNKLIQHQFDEILVSIIKKLEQSQLIKSVKDSDTEELVFEILAMVNNEKIRQFYHTTVQRKPVEDYQIPLNTHKKLLEKYDTNEVDNLIRAVFSAVEVFRQCAITPIKVNKRGEQEVVKVMPKFDAEVNDEVSRIEAANNKNLQESFGYFDKFMIGITKKNRNLLNESRNAVAYENNRRMRERASREKEHHLHTMRIIDED